MGTEKIATGDGWISDDSSFYGDEDEQERLDLLCERFQPTEYWATHKDELNAVAFEHRNMPRPILSNPGGGPGGRPSWQLGETAEDFVKRLPPATTSAELYDGIWVYNPHQQAHGKSKPVRGNAEDFAVRGKQLLARSRQTRGDIEARGPKKARSSVTKLLNEESKLLQQRLTDLAAETNVLFGKWMLFPAPKDVTRVWRLVVDGVINNRLGPAAKVAPDNGTAGARLICVYTEDFRDKDDVLRVLRELVSIGAIGTGTKPIYYKPDTYTYLNIYKQTAAEYGLQASLYSSQKLLAEDKRQQTILTPRTPSSLNRSQNPTRQ